MNIPKCPHMWHRIDSHALLAPVIDMDVNLLDNKAYKHVHDVNLPWTATAVDFAMHMVLHGVISKVLRSFATPLSIVKYNSIMCRMVRIIWHYQHSNENRPTNNVNPNLLHFCHQLFALRLTWQMLSLTGIRTTLVTNFPSMKVVTMMPMPFGA